MRTLQLVITCDKCGLASDEETTHIVTLNNSTTADLCSDCANLIFEQVTFRAAETKPSKTKTKRSDKLPLSERPHQCDTCGRHFATPRGLHQHTTKSHA